MRDRASGRIRHAAPIASTATVNARKENGNTSSDRSKRPTARTMPAANNRARFRRQSAVQAGSILRTDRYLIRVTSLKIGKYIATTSPPTAPPRNTIMSGSSSEVRVLTAVFTSSS